MSGDKWQAFFLLSIIAFMAYQGFKSSNTSDRIKADELREREAETREELAFIRSAKARLPDRLAVIEALRERYTWQQILEAYGVGVLGMELLRHLESLSSISLPNPSARDLNDKERKILRDAKKAASSFGESHDIDTWYQEPTVQTLQELCLAGLMESRAIGSTDGREFTVAITVKGALLLKLDQKFRTPGTRFEIPRRLFQTAEARSEFTSVVRVTLNVSEPNRVAGSI